MSFEDKPIDEQLRILNNKMNFIINKFFVQSDNRLDRIEKRLEGIFK